MTLCINYIVLCLFFQKESTVRLNSFKLLGFTWKSVVHSRNFWNDLVFHCLCGVLQLESCKICSLVCNLVYKSGDLQLPIQEIFTEGICSLVKIIQIFRIHSFGKSYISTFLEISGMTLHFIVMMVLSSWKHTKFSME